MGAFNCCTQLQQLLRFSVCIIISYLICLPASLFRTLQFVCGECGYAHARRQCWFKIYCSIFKWMIWFWAELRLIPFQWRHLLGVSISVSWTFSPNDRLRSERESRQVHITTCHEFSRGIAEDSFHSKNVLVSRRGHQKKDEQSSHGIWSVYWRLFLLRGGISFFYIQPSSPLLLSLWNIPNSVVIR